jgi:hypothetical protein
MHLDPGVLVRHLTLGELQFHPNIVAMPLCELLRLERLYILVSRV